MFTCQVRGNPGTHEDDREEDRDSRSSGLRSRGGNQTSDFLATECDRSEYFAVGQGWSVHVRAHHYERGGNQARDYFVHQAVNQADAMGRGILKFWTKRASSLPKQGGDVESACVVASTKSKFSANIR